MASESLLEIVARHETGLMDDLERAREEARQIVEAAHVESASLQQAALVKLDAKIGEMRRNAARAREEECAAIAEASVREVERIRSESAGRTDEVRKELIARILPGNA